MSAFSILKCNKHTVQFSQRTMSNYLPNATKGNIRIALCPRATHFATKISETRVFPADVGAAYKRFRFPFKIFSESRIVGQRTGDFEGLTVR